MYGHVLTAEEIEASGEDGVPQTPPTLEQYKEQVDTYEKIYNEVNESEVRAGLEDERKCTKADYNYLLCIVIRPPLSLICGFLSMPVPSSKLFSISSSDGATCSSSTLLTTSPQGFFE